MIQTEANVCKDTIAVAGRKLKMLLDSSAARRIAERIRSTCPSFRGELFMRNASASLDGLALMARANQFAQALRGALPLAVEESLDVLVDSLGPPRTEAGYGPDINYEILPLTRFVSLFALQHFVPGMRALREMTRRFTAEFDIRPFIVRYGKRALTMLAGWADDDDQHVRRLVSEGTRPRLPLASHLRCFRQDASPVIRLLELLKDDRSPYVRKSVANSLGDIAKDHPQLVYATLSRWQHRATTGRCWIIRHALRQRCTKGEPEALQLCGFTTRPAVVVQSFCADKGAVPINHSLIFNLTLASRSTRAERLLVQYRLMPSGRVGDTSGAVYKVGTVFLPGGSLLKRTWRHVFVPRVTRPLRRGQYSVELLLNGSVKDVLNVRVV